MPATMVHHLSSFLQVYLVEAIIAAGWCLMVLSPAVVRLIF
jgi:hypothetical protein